MSGRYAQDGTVRDRFGRLCAATIALCGWSGLVIQFLNGFTRSGSIELTLWRMAIFFTVIANLTTATAFTLIALGSVRLRHPRILAGLMLTMALVGLVFELLLRRLLHLSGWRLVSTALLHDAVPLLTVAAWLMLAEKGRLSARDPWIIALFPIAYLFYVLARGAAGGLYPYPFLDVHKLGWLGILPAVLGISAAFLLVGHLIVMLDRRLGRR